ncbi:hypothetical protein P4B35_00915 [Pontiellaceae bacterium B12227]|nr:hypothetical protein [Pontiellaceae bacterium B12227]
MKLIRLSGALIVLSLASGCATNKEKQAEKEAYFEEGKMDQQVEQWKKPGGRY